MSHFQMNFLTKNNPNAILGYVLLGLGLLAMASWYATYSMTNTKILDKEAQLVQQSASRKPMSRKMIDPQQQESVRQMAELQYKMKLAIEQPWDKLFTALENSKPKSIILSEVLPDSLTGRIKLSGHAKQLTEVLKYVHTLKEQATLKEVELLSHQMGQAKVDFEIEAAWH